MVVLAQARDMVTQEAARSDEQDVPVCGAREQLVQRDRSSTAGTVHHDDRNVDDAMRLKKTLHLAREAVAVAAGCVRRDQGDGAGGLPGVLGHGRNAGEARESSNNSETPMP